MKIFALFIHYLVRKKPEYSGAIWAQSFFSHFFIYDLQKSITFPETTNNYRALPSLSKNKNSSNNSTSNVPDWLNDSHYYHGKSFPIKHHPKAGTSSRPKSKEKSTPSRNIDLLDLQFRPENSSLEIVNHRKTQKLMSTEYLSDMQHMLSDSNKPTKSRKESNQMLGFYSIKKSIYILVIFVLDRYT